MQSNAHNVRCVGRGYLVPKGVGVWDGGVLSTVVVAAAAAAAVAAVVGGDSGGTGNNFHFQCLRQNDAQSQELNCVPPLLRLPTLLGLPPPLLQRCQYGRDCR